MFQSTLFINTVFIVIYQQREALPLFILFFFFFLFKLINHFKELEESSFICFMSRGKNEHKSMPRYIMQYENPNIKPKALIRVSNVPELYCLSYYTSTNIYI
jgi:hypothetical protein